MRIGVISDTHGFFHASLPEVFRGVELIIHAGDIGGLPVWERLAAIAPVTAVRGNYDREPELPADLLPDPSPLEVAGLPSLLTHRLITMDWTANRELFAELFSRNQPGLRLVIFGHTHFPVLERVRGVWFVNPGYAGPDRREGPATVARLSITGEEVKGELIRLE